MTQQAKQLQRCTTSFSAVSAVLLLVISLQIISSLYLCQSFQQQPFLSPPAVVSSPSFEQRMREELKQRREKILQHQQPPAKSSTTKTETETKKKRQGRNHHSFQMFEI